MIYRKIKNESVNKPQANKACSNCLESQEAKGNAQIDATNIFKILQQNKTRFVYVILIGTFSSQDENGNTAEIIVAAFFLLFNLIGIPSYPSAYDKFLLAVSLVFNGVTIWLAWNW